MLIAVIVFDNGMFTLGCKERVLRSKVTAADFHPDKDPLLSVSQVPPTIMIGVRETTAKASGGQVYLKCQWNSKYMSGHCIC